MPVNEPLLETREAFRLYIDLPQRSFERVADLKPAVDAALAEKAAEIQRA